MPTQLPRMRFTVDRYHEMIDAGVLTEDDRVELLDGEIVEMCPIGTSHAACVNRLTRRSTESLGRRAIVAVQNPVTLGDLSEPQPDLSILRPTPDFYGSRHPGTQDIFWLIEVGDTTADRDRDAKIPIYAENGVSEVWLVDLSGETIEVFRQPVAGAYSSITRHGRGESVASAAFPDISFPVDDILG